MMVSFEQLTNRALALSLLLLQGVKHASGHYGFPFLLVDGVASKRWEYVRPTTSMAPNFDYSGPDGMCGVNATKAQFPIKTLKVEAGSTVAFLVNFKNYDNISEADITAPWDSESWIYHRGPATGYLSKAPGEPNDYQGDGDWFKIGVIGATDGMHWDYGYNMKRTMNFTIPRTTPPGKYLLRAEHLNIYPSYKATEMYLNCAHIEITGPGGGTPGPTTKFPGAFDAEDPGIWLPAVLDLPGQPMEQLRNWQGAGPKVWKG